MQLYLLYMRISKKLDKTVLWFISDILIPSRTKDVYVCISIYAIFANTHILLFTYLESMDRKKLQVNLFLVTCKKSNDLLIVVKNQANYH